MKRITTAASALILAAAPAFAQESGGGDKADWSQLVRTRDITGGPVYTTNEAYDEGSWGGDRENPWGWSGHDSVGDDWNQIGEIEDVILSKSGQIEGVVAEVGGFLDVGDKHVLLRVGDVDLVPVDDQSYVVITRHSEEELEELEGIDEAVWE